MRENQPVSLSGLLLTLLVLMAGVEGGKFIPVTPTNDTGTFLFQFVKSMAKKTVLGRRGSLAGRRSKGAAS